MFTQGPKCSYEEDLSGAIYATSGYTDTSVIKEKNIDPDDCGLFTNREVAQAAIAQQLKNGVDGFTVNQCLLELCGCQRLVNFYNYKKLTHLLERLVPTGLVSKVTRKHVEFFSINLEEIQARKDGKIVNLEEDTSTDPSSSEEWSEGEDYEPPAKRPKTNPEETKGPACPN
jgi:hypothetical protein